MQPLPQSGINPISENHFKTGSAEEAVDLKQSFR
jgi:hypothetical protein